MIFLKKPQIADKVYYIIINSKLARSDLDEKIFTRNFKSSLKIDWKKDEFFPRKERDKCI